MGIEISNKAADWSKQSFSAKPYVVNGIETIACRAGGISVDGRSGSEDGKDLRSQISKFTKYIRICSLNTEQFCQEVAPSRVLTDQEGMTVAIAIGKREKQEELTEFCNEVKQRKFLSKKNKQKVILKLDKHTRESAYLHKDFSFTIVTKECDVELLPLECLALKPPQPSPEGATYEVGCSTTITRITDCANNTSIETPVTVRFDKQVEYGKSFEIPLIKNGRNVTLLPNSKYTIRMLFDRDQRMYLNGTSFAGSYVNNHLSLYITTADAGGGYCHYIPMNCFVYKTSAG